MTLVSNRDRQIPPIRTGSKTHWAVEGEQRKHGGQRRGQKKPKTTQTLFNMMEGRREGRREKPTKTDGMLLISCLGVRMDKEWRRVAVGAAHTVSAKESRAAGRLAWPASRSSYLRREAGTTEERGCRGLPWERRSWNLLHRDRGDSSARRARGSRGRIKLTDRDLGIPRLALSTLKLLV